MASKMVSVVLFVLLCVYKASAQSNSFTDPLKINFPDLLVHAVSSGNVNLQTLNGDIKIKSNGTGKILFDNEDLNYIIQQHEFLIDNVILKEGHHEMIKPYRLTYCMIVSQPPIWEEHSPFAFLGEFHAGQRLDVTVRAKDPEGHLIRYSVVAGTFPPGIKLEADSGRIYGLVPDSDATYTITIRATDVHGQYADSVFKIVTRGIVYCSKKPCVNQGVCQDLITGYKCFCPNPYGGLRCEIDCRNHHLIGPTSAKAIPDASLSGYNMYSTNVASGARMNAGGWYGMDSTSYLQVDLGNVSHIDNFQIKGRDSSSSRYYYTGTFYIQYSTDGNTFNNFTSSSNANVYTFSGISYNSIHKVDLPGPLDTRFIRVFPLSWNRSYRPYMNLEINGCHNN